jgi:hypothetical protein
MRANHLGSGQNDSRGSPEGDGRMDAESDEHGPGRAEGAGEEAAEPVRKSPNLFDLLRSRVRAASDGQLVLSASLGVAGFLTLVAARRWPWAGIAACTALLGAGLWGVLDRTPPAPALLGHAVPAPLMLIARLASGALALLALLALMLGAFGLCLGTWIS